MLEARVGKEDADELALRVLARERLGLEHAGAREDLVARAELHDLGEAQVGDVVHW